MLRRDVLNAVPNPFAFLDHDGLPAGTYPMDHVHAQGSRRWIGAAVDPERTRRIPRPGDITASVPVLGPGGKPTLGPDRKPIRRRVFVDRAPMKEIRWNHVVNAATPVLDTGHHRLGFREGSLIPGDAETAKRLGVTFVPVEEALRAAAEKAIKEFTDTYGEPPPVDTWPENLRALAGLDDDAPATPNATGEPPQPAATASTAAPAAPTTDTNGGVS